jgi:hypothetical protein
MKRPLILKNLEEVLALLEKIKHNTEVSVSGTWDLNQNLTHCAQSLEYAMSGYPFEKSKIFQSMVGPLIFSYFDWRGYMRHATNELIPGEPVIPADREDGQGILQLEQAIAKFDAWECDLFPHRFYGKLTKKQYAKAHTMHIANHLELIQF